MITRQKLVNVKSSLNGIKTVTMIAVLAIAMSIDDQPSLT